MHAVAVEKFGTEGDQPVLLLLHGVSGPSDFYREQASFFAKHGYFVLLPHFLDAGHGNAASDSNYAAWVDAVQRIVDERRKERGGPVVMAGYSLGASVALALGSRGNGPDAIADFYGSLPDAYFYSLKGMPPLLIVHGEQDTNIPVRNALQLAELCRRLNVRHEEAIYPGEGHGLSATTLKDADERTLRFFGQVTGKLPSPA